MMETAVSLALVVLLLVAAYAMGYHDGKRAGWWKAFLRRELDK